ncbi:MAG: nucleoside recognition protein [Armatimonadetes bacterium]|nr:nucleoside recognition protein [Armatimonadota bacterium]
MLSAETFKRGLHKGLFTLWEMTKIVIPVYLAVTFFKYTPVLDWIIKACAPLMHLFGLSGEAAVPLVLGNVLNLYAAIGAITSLHLSSREITILAIMLLISHNLLVESAVSGRTGVNALAMGGFRLGLSFLCGALLNLLL